jgi:VWFA-related protein
MSVPTTRTRAVAVLSAAALLFAPLASLAQETPTTTLHVTSRAVLIDVVVTDANGNSVHGLPQSAFHIADNARPQSINAFEEHTGAPVAAPATGPALPTGVVTNAAVLNAPPVENIVLIDTTNMDILDQMYLYQRLTHFIQDLPPGVPIAIFLRAFDFSVMLQNFTADHALLQAALRKAIPHPQLASGAEMHEIAGLVQVGGYLSQLPGRKNLLWFNGGSSEFTHPGPWSNLSQTGAAPNTDGSTRADVDASIPAPSEDIRLFFDLLQTARVALYPIDARGLNPQYTAALDNQHLDAISFADATGGRAFYNENKMDVVAAKAMQNGDSFYTLSYSPTDLRNNGRWHTVNVTVEGGHYTLSYRRGYFDDGPDTPHPLAEKTGLLKVGNQQIDAPNPRSQPLIFRAQLQPASSGGAVVRHGQAAWRVHFDIPAVELQQTIADGKGSASVGAAIVAFNQQGQPIGHVSQKIALDFDEALYKQHPMAALSFDQQLAVNDRVEAFLYIAVWDTATGRMGTLETPLKPTQAATH